MLDSATFAAEQQAFPMSQEFQLPAALPVLLLEGKVVDPPTDVLANMVLQKYLIISIPHSRPPIETGPKRITVGSFSLIPRRCHTLGIILDCTGRVKLLYTPPIKTLITYGVKR